MLVDDKFLAGYIAAVQFIAIDNDKTSIAEEAIFQSGYSLKEVLNVQKKSGYHTRKMNKIIKNAFKRFN